MLDQKIFGEKLRNHRKRLGMTQEEVAEKIGVSPQAISKWEAGDCLPDCFNLKSISDIYKISADILLETQSADDINAVSERIEQLGTEFIWAKSYEVSNNNELHRELGEDLWKMWKGIYFAEVGDRKMQEEDKKRGNLRIIGSFGTKIWDDDGVICIVQSELIKKLSVFDPDTIEIIKELCSEDGQKLILSLKCDAPTSKHDLIENSGIDVPRLNELLLLFTENKLIVYSAENHPQGSGYIISGHCGIAAYMVLAAMFILKKKAYTASSYYLSI